MSHISHLLTPPLNILIADADRMGANLVAGELTRGRQDINVVAVSNNSGETIRKLEEHRPHVALINAHLGDGPLKGYHVLQNIHSACPQTQAIMMIPVPERDLVIDAFRGGARGVFCRVHSVKLLSKCIRTVHKGEVWANNQNLEFILEFLTRLKPLRIVKPGGGMNRLTPRETEVVHLLADGTSTRDISRSLGVTEHTIRNYLSNIYEKLGVSSRVELALYAVDRQETPVANVSS